MSDKFRDRQGSKSADLWRFIHKKLPGCKSFYGLDLDFILVGKFPFPHIVGVLDIKVKGHETVDFSHIIAYNYYCLAPEPYRSPVFIVQINSGFEQMEQSLHRMDIYRYVMGNPYPDDTPYTVEPVANGLTWGEYVTWEQKLRNERKAELEEWENRQRGNDLLRSLANRQIEATWGSVQSN